MSGSRQRMPLKRPIWIVLLLSVVSIFFIGAFVYYPLERHATCYLFSSGCTGYKKLPPVPVPVPVRELTDEEVESRVVNEEILKMDPVQSTNPKIAFLFLTPGTLPFEPLWDKFFHGHAGKFTVYVHASTNKPVHVSRYFVNRDIHREQVAWGKISMVDAEKRLVANALRDPDNQHFVLLSDSCVPMHSFDYVYKYLMFTNVSFIDCFNDPGPHGMGRYSPHMLPEVERNDFRKGSQWFSMKRKHAILVMSDNLYYTKFRLYCKPGMEGGRNCYADEHYLPTFLRMIDPNGIAYWSVTHVDWSEGKWHPKSYRSRDVTFELLQNITSIDAAVHITSGEKRRVLRSPCLWNGRRRPCYLFARKFFPEALDTLITLFSNYTTVLSSVQT